MGGITFLLVDPPDLASGLENTVIVTQISPQEKKIALRVDCRKPGRNCSCWKNQANALVGSNITVPYARAVASVDKIVVE